MILGSLLLILVAVVLLGIGLARGSNTLLIGSIAASLFAAIALVVGARQAVAGRVGEPDEFDEAVESHSDDEDYQPDLARVPVAAGRPTGGPTGGQLIDGRFIDEHPAESPPAVGAPAEPARSTGVLAGVAGVPAQAGAAGPAGVPVQAGAPVAADEELDDEDPPDEPPAQPISPADAARVAGMSIEVLVVDGRPRYHLAGCMHLLGRPTEPLPVSEAIELGFSPCSLCEPDSAILAEVRRA